MKWPKVIGPTQMSALTETQVGGANLKMPALAKSILAIIPQFAKAGVETAAESDVLKITLKSDDFPINPYVVLAQPINAGVGADIAGYREEAPIYPVNCPVQGGSELGVYAQGLVDHTQEPYVTVTVIVADFLAVPQYHAKVGVHTAMGAATAGETKGTAIRLTGCHSIREVNAYAVDTTIASGKGIIGKFRLSSAGFKGMGDVEWAAEPVGGILAGAAGQGCTRLSRVRDLDIPITDPIDIDPYFNLGVAISTAGAFNHGIIYV